MEHRPTFTRHDSETNVDQPNSTLESSNLNTDKPVNGTSEASGISDEKDASYMDEKRAGDAASVKSVAPSDLLADGTERPIETAHDLSTRCMSLEDDPSLPIHTLRMYFLGLGLTAFAAVLSQIFYFRPQTVFVSGIFLQMISYMLGNIWYYVLPKPSRGRFWAFLTPGIFNIKEHVAIQIMASTASSSALAISVFAAEDLYYNLTPSYGVGIFTLLGSQMFGYALAGFARSFCVFPTYIVFPALLPTVNLFDALHRDKNTFTHKKKLRFFWMVFVAIFVWEWFPEFIAPTLVGISIFCLAKKDSPWVTRIFGGANGNEGLGLFSICLDWNYVGSGGGSLGALFTPFNTQVSLYFGVMLCIIISTSMYATNTWNAQNLPFLSQALFYENGTQYDQLLILDADNQLNQTALDIQGIPWFTPTTAIYYLGSNLAIGASITHVLVWYMPSIIEAFRQYRTREQPDEHYQKMLVYKEVPMWWYGSIGVVSFSMAMATAYAGHSHLPWWALIISLLLAAVIFPFTVVIYATTGFSVEFQQLAQMLGAALSPGNPQANLYFTLYGSNTVLQARGLTEDLKLGQYTKLPPRATFIVQILGTIVGALLQFFIMKLLINEHRDIFLSVQGTPLWSGQQVSTYNSLAVSWGALAKSMYATSSPYFIIPLGIPIGLLVPLPFWFLHSRYPKLGADRVVTPIICWCLGYLSVGINSSIFMTMLIALFSQYYLRVHRPTWFRKYNFLLSAALDGGTQSFVFIFTFAIAGGNGYPKSFPNWGMNPNSTIYNPDWCMSLN